MKKFKYRTGTLYKMRSNSPMLPCRNKQMRLLFLSIHTHRNSCVFQTASINTGILPLKYVQNKPEDHIKNHIKLLSNSETF